MILYDAIALQAAGRGLNLKWMIYIVLAWLALALVAHASVPFTFPLEAQGEMVTSAVVVGLVLPLSVMARMLDEGSPHLVAGASRRLAGTRCAWVATFLTTTGVGAVGAWLVAPVPFELFVSDALFLGSSTVLGVGLLGSRLGWLIPTAIAFVASAPNLVPWQANLLYREGMASTLLPLAAAVGLAAIGAYGRNGGYGLLTTQAARRADATLSID